MKVSIIIPIYNAEKFISKCIESVLNQTYHDLEIILVNDGSTDETLKIIQQYQNKDERIKIIDKENAGVSDSRNRGIEIATGEYIAFADSDDWLELNMIEKMVNIIEQQNVDMVRCNYYKNYSNNIQSLGEKYNPDIIDRILFKQDIQNKILTSILNGTMPAYVYLLLVRKEFIKKVMRFNTNISMMEDTVFYVDLLQKVNKMYIYDEPLYHYFFNVNSLSRSPQYYIRNLNNLLLVNKLFKEILCENNAFNDNIEKIYNTMHMKSIENTFFRLYKTYDREELKKYYDDIINNNKIKEILEKGQINDVPIHNRIAIKLIKNKKIYQLIKYYDFRIKFSKLKTFITKRIEN